MIIWHLWPLVLVIFKAMSGTEGATGDRCSASSLCGNSRHSRDRCVKGVCKRMCGWMDSAGLDGFLGVANDRCCFAYCEEADFSTGYNKNFEDAKQFCSDHFAVAGYAGGYLLTLDHSLHGIKTLLREKRIQYYWFLTSGNAKDDETALQYDDDMQLLNWEWHVEKLHKIKINKKVVPPFSNKCPDDSEIDGGCLPEDKCLVVRFSDYFLAKTSCDLKRCFICEAPICGEQQIFNSTTRQCESCPPNTVLEVFEATETAECTACPPGTGVSDEFKCEPLMGTKTKTTTKTTTTKTTTTENIPTKPPSSSTLELSTGQSTQPALASTGEGSMQSTSVTSTSGLSSQTLEATTSTQTACPSGQIHVWKTNDDSKEIVDDSDNVTGVSTIDVITSGKIADINVQLTIEHTWPGDLKVFLYAPDGTEIELVCRLGTYECGGNSKFGIKEDHIYTDTIFDAEASASILSQFNGPFPISGPFKPTGDLTKLYGMEAKGTWKLGVADYSLIHTGTLVYWTLDMCIVPRTEIESDDDDSGDSDDSGDVTDDVSDGIPADFEDISSDDNDESADVSADIDDLISSAENETDLDDDVGGVPADFEDINGDSDNNTDVSADIVDLISSDENEPDEGGDNDKTSGQACPSGQVHVRDTNDESKEISDNTHYVTGVSSIDVTSTGTIADINVQLTIEHTWPGDLMVFLSTPDGTEIELVCRLGTKECGGTSRYGVHEDHIYTDTTFDAEASASILSRYKGPFPITGPFQPTGDLTKLYGKQAQGRWTLGVADYSRVHTGSLIYWTLDMCVIP